MKIAVFLHLYYTEMLDELLSHIENLSALQDIEYDLIVTLCHKNPELEQKIYAFKDNAQIMLVPNRGYDVAPFLQAVKSIHLSGYDYIIKLHSKRDLSSPAYLPSCTLYGCEWRQNLLEFMSSPKHLQESLLRFDNNPQIGMLTAPELIISAYKEDHQALDRATQIMHGMGLSLKNKTFVAGTMFIARASLFRLWKHLPYDASDFEEFNPTHKGGSLAHALERVLGFMISAQGFQISSYYPVGFSYKMKVLGYKFRNFIYYKRTNSSGKTHIKIFKIPVYSKSKK